MPSHVQPMSHGWSSAMAISCVPSGAGSTFGSATMMFVTNPFDSSQTAQRIDHLYAVAMQRHFDVWPLYWNPTVTGKVVEPFDVVGTEAVLFSVLVQPMVCVAALKS